MTFHNTDACPGRKQDLRRLIWRRITAETEGDQNRSLGVL